jgi:hypothetical protein
MNNENINKTAGEKEAVSLKTETELPETPEAAQAGLATKAQESIKALDSVVAEQGAIVAGVIGEEKVPGVEVNDAQQEEIIEKGKKGIEEITNTYNLEIAKREKFLKSQRYSDKEGSKNYQRYQEFKNNPAQHLIDLHQKDLDSEREALKKTDNEEDRAMHLRNISMLEDKINTFSQKLNEKEESVEGSAENQENKESVEDSVEDGELFNQFNQMDAYIKEIKKESPEKSVKELAFEYLKITQEDYNNKPEIKKKVDALFAVPQYRQIQESTYVKNNYDNLEITEFIDKKDQIVEAVEASNFIDKKINESEQTYEDYGGLFAGKYDIDNLSLEDYDAIKELVKTAQCNGIYDKENMEKLLDKGIIDSDDIVSFLNQKSKSGLSYAESLASLPNSLLQKVDIIDKINPQLIDEEQKKPLDSSDVRMLSSVIFGKIAAAEMMHGVDSKQVQEYYNLINKTIKELADNPMRINKFFAHVNNKMFSDDRIDKTALKKVFNKYIVNCKERSSNVSEQSIKNILLAKKQGLITEEEFKQIYPDKI